MSRLTCLFRCFVQAVCAKGPKALAGLLPFGDVFYDIVTDFRDRLSQMNDPTALSGGLREIAEADKQTKEAEAREVVRQEAGNRGNTEQVVLMNLLNHWPSNIGPPPPGIPQLAELPPYLPPRHVVIIAIPGKLSSSQKCDLDQKWPIITDTPSTIYPCPAHFYGLKVSHEVTNFTPIQSLRAFRELVCIELVRCAALTDTDLVEDVQNLHQLHYLDLGECSQLTDAGLVSLAGLRELKVLHLYKCKFTGQGLAHLRAVPNLVGLNLWECRNLVETQLVYLDQFQKLQWLSLCDTCVTHEGLFHVGRLISLKKLNLSWCRRLRDPALVHLQGLANLRELDLRHTQVTAGGVQTVQTRLPNCKILWP